jgi:hypothetical protein
MTAVGYWSWSVVWDFLLGVTTFGERCSLSLSWLSFGSSVASRIILSVKGYGARGCFVPMVG